MKVLRLIACLSAVALAVGAASPALALANRVFVSARSGNNLNSCDNVTTPCQTFAGAVLQLNPDGEIIVLDSGGYGPVTITQGVTIEAPAGVTAFIHPPSGDAITIAAGSTDTVTLRGLTLNVGTSKGITVNSVGTVNVENCLIAGFASNGITMFGPGRLNVRETVVRGCTVGIAILNTTGAVRASIEHCRLEGNFWGFDSATTAPGSSTTTARQSTSDNNTDVGWLNGGGTSGRDVLILESCSGSENGGSGLVGNSANALSATRYSNCVFANNDAHGVERNSVAPVESRGNNTITGNAMGPTSGTIDPFLPM